MNELNYKQTMFIMNISESASMHLFVNHFSSADASYILSHHRVVGKEETDAAQKRRIRKEVQGKSISVKELSAHFNVDIDVLIASINRNFWKDQQCMNYLEGYFNKKFVRNKWNMFPLSMVAPVEVTSFMDSDNLKRLEEWFDERYVVEDKNDVITYCRLVIK